MLARTTPIRAGCRVNLHVVKLNGAAVRITPHAINASDTSLFAGFSTDVKTIAASLSLWPTELSSPECVVDRSATGDVVCTVGGTNPEATVRVLLPHLKRNLPLGNDGDRPSISSSWTVVVPDETEIHCLGRCSYSS